MKKQFIRAALVAAFVGVAASRAFAQLTVPSDGSDGALNITSDSIIDLSQAVTAAWDSNNSANAGKGVYDSNKWAVVFKYSSVNIAGVGNPVSGRTVSFLNHASRAPVVWIVQGNVNIGGIIQLSGRNGVSGPDALLLTEPGPGGSRGGALGPAGNGAGLGWGGSSGPNGSSAFYRSTYGNPKILPLIGGSGTGPDISVAGASGGGAILIVAGGTVTVNGMILSKPGVAYPGGGNYENYASGGAIKIIAASVQGTGTLDAEREGRTRIEANTISQDLRIFPSTVAVPPGNPPVVWPPASAPTARILSVDSQTSPADPVAGLSTSSDVAIQNNSPVQILIETKNLPVQGVVQLRIAPKYGSHYFLGATLVSGNFAQASWSVTTPLPSGFCVLQARATAP
jgi:hypothetical protein